MHGDPSFPTIRQFARRLKVTPRRARALVAAGLVDGAVKMGRDWLIPTATRVAPGTREPGSRAIGQGSQLALAEGGQGQTRKRRRQKHFWEGRGPVAASGARLYVPSLAFVRITTRAGIMRAPLSPDQVVGFIDAWLAQPYVALIGPSDGHWPVFRNLPLSGGTAGNLTSDAHLAALAIEHGCEIASADNDLRRFTGVTLVNPVAND